MSGHEFEGQTRQTTDAINLIDQALVYHDTSLMDRANRQILQMNQYQRDAVEQGLVRQGLLPAAAISMLSGETVNDIDRNHDGRLNRQEVDQYLLGQVRQPANERNFVREMVINQIANRMGDESIRSGAINNFADRLSAQTGYEQAIREYPGILAVMRQRYPSQCEGGRFEISAARQALTDDASTENHFLSADQRNALNFMIAHEEDLYKTRLGIGTWFGMFTEYFDGDELNRNARNLNVNPDQVRATDASYRHTLEEIAGDAGTVEHRVERGQTLSDIARIYFRQSEGREPTPDELSGFAERIARANHAQAPFHPPVGQTVRIPRVVHDEH